MLQQLFLMNIFRVSAE